MRGTGSGGRVAGDEWRVTGDGAGDRTVRAKEKKL